MSSRERILDRIRAGITTGAPRSSAGIDRRVANAARHIAARERHLIPARTAGMTADRLVDELRKWLELAGAQLVEVAALEDVPAVVIDVLARRSLPLQVRMGEDPRLAQVPWSREPRLAIETGAADSGDAASVTHALAAVAETGTLVLASGAENPVTLSFLPECAIVLVERGDVVGPLEDALAKLREVTRGIGLPRTVNLVSGPSRSADIGGVPVLGAHGPRHLCVLVVGRVTPA
jgi:L-lactate dehydrogenase complex protein LldG